MHLRPYQSAAIEAAARQRSQAAEYMRKWRERNRERARENSRRQYAADPEKRKAATRKWAANNRIALKRIKFACSLKRHGIDVEDYARLFNSQGGCCAGCRDVLDDGWHTAVDHCHRTGKVRGLLCIRCNRSIGVLRESPETLRRLADYIERHRR